jgi:dTDP-4-dehydrorhamnose 3,5-epimerase
MKLIETSLPGVLIIEPRVFRDERGFFLETYHALGEIYDVAVDIRPDSPTFGKWVGFTLSADNFRQAWIPPGFAHGFCVTSEVAEVEYKCTDFYDPPSERGLIWNDPAVGIIWPIQDPILSERDKKHPRLSALVAS